MGKPSESRSRGHTHFVFFTLPSMLLLTVGVALLLTAVAPSLAEADSSSAEYREWQEFKEFQEFQAWKKSVAAAARERKTEDGHRSARKGTKRHQEKKSERRDDPPPIDQAALMARYIVNQAGWTSVATISSRKDIESYPFVNIISFSDGPLGNGSGIPYLFLTPLDFTAQDVFKDNRATLMMTLAQGQYCHVKNYDPMDPRCARVVLSGKIKAVKEDNPEYPAAKSAVFGRHPWLANMPKDHHFFFAKLKIGTIAVLDTFGGPKYVTIKDYLHPPKVNVLDDYATRYEIEENDSVFRSLQQPVAINF